MKSYATVVTLTIEDNSKLLQQSKMVNRMFSQNSN